MELTPTPTEIDLKKVYDTASWSHLMCSAFSFIHPGTALPDGTQLSTEDYIALVNRIEYTRCLARLSPADQAIIVPAIAKIWEDLRVAWSGDSWPG